jgi:hypothetical protein
MPKAFSVASWNVEHFRSQGVSSRVEGDHGLPFFQVEK